MSQGLNGIVCDGCWAWHPGEHEKMPNFWFEDGTRHFCTLTCKTDYEAGLAELRKDEKENR